ncbi:MAG TPA: MBL fold metallo-hydrolase [Pseudonocardiaceae bacterium]|jgi:L-ascorbate metabolism protein UlaG (beta-lactamase superfamily)|nr:MBL fold metallo-hydrolase [Pseudonocardiaceae bacterium]
MADGVSAQRREFAIGVLGGPTTVIDIAGSRLVMDPTFDPPGDHGYLTKLRGPAVAAAELGAVDAVLVSHDNHPDNLDTSGREFALAAPRLFAGPRAAARLGSPATGLAEWQTVQLPRGDGRGDFTIRAVPAMHGPADGARDEDGHVNTEVTGFVLSGSGLPTVYLSGDNASIGVVTEVARRIGPVDVAVLFIGAARVPSKERGRPLTLTSQRAAAAAAVLSAPVVVPAHYDSWAHFSEGADDIVTAFDEAGLSHVLQLAPPGEWVLPAAG